jgi:transposase
VLTVTDINYIKQEVNIKGRSYSDVARQMGRDPRTIKKYADKEDWNKYKQVRKAKVMEPVKPIVDKWLQEDLKNKKKYRRTANRIFDQLVSDFSLRGQSAQ